VSPESSDYMGTALWALEEARSLLEDDHYEIACREAYTAALNAARAILFEKTGKAHKTHSGTRAELHKLILEGLPFPKELADFLSEGFDIKQRIDYGPIARKSREEAAQFVDLAAAFVEAARVVLDADG
jgi:uncharacterized protein (UPF0332 family)